MCTPAETMLASAAPHRRPRSVVAVHDVAFGPDRGYVAGQRQRVLCDRRGVRAPGALGSAPGLRSVLVVGFLGAFTTFSTFALETVELWEAGQGVQALLYTLASVCTCILGAAAGIAVTRAFL
jgi:hypothetical protein